VEDHDGLDHRARRPHDRRADAEDTITPHTRPPTDEETDDGLSGEEGTFLICSFWLVSALMIVGEQQRARDLMERLLRQASPLGLYTEEFDTATGHHLGNFPQAFSHLALLDAAARIILQERLSEPGRSNTLSHGASLRFGRFLARGLTQRPPRATMRSLGFREGRTQA
jgi:Glycosyl hydrolases family 15